MTNLILTIFQLVVPILLIVCILLQQKSTALGSAFGGEGGFYMKRRGAEKKIFWVTVVLGIIFIFTSLLNLALL